jgi:hypothetical protein
MGADLPGGSTRATTRQTGDGDDEEDGDEDERIR